MVNSTTNRTTNSIANTITNTTANATDNGTADSSNNTTTPPQKTIELQTKDPRLSDNKEFKPLAT